MKELEKEFLGKGEVSGTKFKQLKASSKAFIYELEDIETGFKRYEVFERRKQKEMTVNMGGQEITYEAKELYPKSNSFGSWAWCTTDLDRAIEIFNRIETQKEKNADTTT